MGIQVNIGDHTSSQAGYLAVPSGDKRYMCNWARIKARTIARTIPSANVYFKTLPGGRTLTELLADSTIWINYQSTMTFYGQAVLSGTELAIGNSAFRKGRWTVVATLIHELCHINGVPGGTDRRAEESLLHCGLGKQSERTNQVDDPNTPYEPGIEG